MRTLIAGSGDSVDAEERIPKKGDFLYLVGEGLTYNDCIEVEGGVRAGKTTWGANLYKVFDKYACECYCIRLENLDRDGKAAWGEHILQLGGKDAPKSRRTVEELELLVGQLYSSLDLLVSSRNKAVKIAHALIHDSLDVSREDLSFIEDMYRITQKITPRILHNILHDTQVVTSEPELKSVFPREGFGTLGLPTSVTEGKKPKSVVKYIREFSMLSSECKRVRLVATRDMTTHLVHVDVYLDRVKINHFELGDVTEDCIYPYLCAMGFKE